MQHVMSNGKWDDMQMRMEDELLHVSANGRWGAKHGRCGKWKSMYLLMEAWMHMERRKWKWKMGLHAYADGEWDEKHVIAFVEWDVKCFRMKWKVEWSETCSSSWERTCNFFQNGEKTEMQISKTQKQAQNKHMPLVLNSNMSTSKLLSSANSNLEFSFVFLLFLVSCL